MILLPRVLPWAYETDSLSGNLLWLRILFYFYWVMGGIDFGVAIFYFNYCFLCYRLPLQGNTEDGLDLGWYPGNKMPKL